jgi:arylsulfatase A-like enzyme
MRFNTKLFLLAFLVCSTAVAVEKPNILLILVDDMGYGDLSCYGGQMVATPNIDALARQGVRFTDGYVTSPVCAPSRCGLLAGAYNQRFGMQWNEDLYEGHAYTIPAEHKLISETLMLGGYVTGQSGKWNISRDVRQAFHEVSHVMNWKGHYFADDQDNFLGVDGHGGREINGDEVHGWGSADPDDPYLTEVLTDNAVSFIRRHASGTKPFFFYLAYNAVHTPLQARKSAKFDHLPHEPLRIYAAMIESLDQSVGRVLEALRAAGIEKNTLVVFASDNGAAMGNPRIKGWHSTWPERVLLGSVGPLNGHKAQNLEGGIRVPLIISWPAELKPCGVYSSPVSTMDLYPTLCAAAAVQVPTDTVLDGVDLLPYLQGDTFGTPHKRLFWMHNKLGAVRQNKWKLVINTWKPRLVLYDLTKDIGERRNLADDYPELTRSLHHSWQEWAAEMPPRSNPPPKFVSGWLSGTFQSVKIRPAAGGEPFAAWELVDQYGMKHLIYYRLLKKQLTSAEMRELAGKTVRINGRRRLTRNGSTFEGIDKIVTK